MAKKRTDVSNEAIKHFYTDEGLSPALIAPMLRLSEHGVRYRILQMGIKRTASEATRLSHIKGRAYSVSGAANPNWKGGRRRLDNGYLGILCPNHPRAHAGYVREHILVWEQAQGQLLPKDWVVHHLNGIRTDNRPENLVAMARSGHTRREFGELLKKRIRELENEIRGLKAQVHLLPISGIELPK